VTLAAERIGKPYVALSSFGNAAVFYSNEIDDTLWLRVAAEKAFGPPLRVDGGNGRPSLSTAALINVGASGYLAFWSEANAGYGAYARRYESAGGAIQTLGEQSSAIVRPYVAVNASGNGMVVIGEQDTGSSIRTTHLVARAVRNGNLGVEETIVPRTSSLAVLAVLTDVADSGAAVLAWQQVVTSTYSEIWVRRRAASGELEESELVVGDVDLGLEKVFVTDSGGVVVLWRGDASRTPVLWEREFAAGSGWGAARRIGFALDQMAGATALSRARSGATMWVWRENLRDVTWLHCWIRSPDGTWEQQTIDATGLGSVEPVVESYDRESFRVVYGKQPAFARFELWSVRYVAGRGFLNQEAIAIESYDHEMADIALDGSGRGAVVWGHRVTPPVDTTYLRLRWLE
jgi:hypothetical protein